MTRATLSTHQLRQVSVAATIDPRTVRRYLDGVHVTEHSRLRIEAALRSCSLERLIRGESDDQAARASAGG